MSGYVCTFSKVSKDYGGNSIFRDIDMEILEGERIGLVGENGGVNRRYSNSWLGLILQPKA